MIQYINQITRYSRPCISFIILLRRWQKNKVACLSSGNINSRQNKDLTFDDRTRIWHLTTEQGFTIWRQNKDLTLDVRKKLHAFTLLKVSSLPFQLTVYCIPNYLLSRIYGVIGTLRSWFRYWIVSFHGSLVLVKLSNKLHYS